jgi:3-oxoadipate enol-lactonase
MPIIDANGISIDVEVTGPDTAPVLMLSSSLGTTKHMWDPQMDAFAKDYRVVRYDRRGHGNSALPKGPYNMEMLARDAVAIMDGLKLDRVNWLGLSMGGMEGMWLGAKAGNRIDKLILSNTSAYYADKSVWHTRMENVEKAGSVAAIADMVINAWLTKDFQSAQPDTTARMKEMMIATKAEGYLACCAAAKDPATNVAAAEFIRDQIPGAKLAIVEAAHISNVEVPQDFARIVLDFLKSK